MTAKAGTVTIALALLVLAGCAGGRPSAPKATPEQERARDIRLAESYFRAGRTSEAIDLLRGVVEKDPSNAGLHNFLGQMQFLAGRLPDAEASLRRAIELDPYLADAHNNLGAVLDRSGRKDEAEQEFRTALAAPSYATPEKAHLNLGLLFASQGRDEEGIQQLRKAVELNPKFHRAHYELASLLDRADKLDEAVRIYEAAAPDYRNDPEFNYRIGFAYFRLGQNDRARVHLSKVLDLAPGSENAVKADEILKLVR